MKRTITLLSVSFAIAFQSIGADTTEQAAIVDCAEGPANIRNIVEPLSDNTRTFANGSIRVIYLDTGEPVCCSSYLAILAPPAPESFGDRQCKLLVSNPNGSGFMDLSIGEIKSLYDPDKGLLLIIPVEHYVDGVASNPTRLDVRIHQGNGTILLE